MQRCHYFIATITLLFDVEMLLLIPDVDADDDGEDIRRAAGARSAAPLIQPSTTIAADRHAAHAACRPNVDTMSDIVRRRLRTTSEKYATSRFAARCHAVTQIRHDFFFFRCPTPRRHATMRPLARRAIFHAFTRLCYDYAIFRLLSPHVLPLDTRLPFHAAPRFAAMLAPCCCYYLRAMMRPMPRPLKILLLMRAARAFPSRSTTRA